MVRVGLQTALTSHGEGSVVDLACSSWGLRDRILDMKENDAVEYSDNCAVRLGTLKAPGATPPKTRRLPKEKNPFPKLRLVTGTNWQMRPRRPCYASSMCRKH